MTKRFLLAALLLLPSAALLAAPPEPVQVTVSGPFSPAHPGERVEVTFQVRMEAEWHIYAPTSPPAAGIPFSVAPDPANPFQASEPLSGPPPKVHEDPYLGRQEIYEGAVTLTQAFLIPADAKPGAYALKGITQGQACDPRMCVDIPAAPWEVRVVVEAGASRQPAAPAAGRTGAGEALKDGPWSFFLVALAWGFATLLTPCVYPMVPVTIAYFSKQEKTGSAAAALAAVYAAGIVVLFTLIGVLASLLVKGGVVAFGNNPWVNLFVGTIFVVFALSLFGAFNLTLPSGLMGRLAGGAKEGYLGALFLGFVFAVTSFACTAPFAGSILAIGLQSGNWAWPVVGMLGFSAALALPFFFLAMFPGMLRSLPRSGSWMETVKHVCAFVELGAALKFLGAADIVLLEADFLTRPVVVALWAALAGATGLYLLGLYRFHDEPDEGIGTPRVLAGTCFLALAFYFGVGAASGGRLGPWEAFLTVPDSEVSPAANGRQGHSELPWHQGDLEAALAEARRDGKRVLIDFSAPT